MSYVPKVLSVNDVVFNWHHEKRLLITATGEVPTSGWSGARLAPRFYTQEPADGIWDFDFLADSPIGPVLNVVLPVQAEAVFGAPPWLTGVCVHAGANDLLSVAFPGAPMVPPTASKPSPSVVRNRAIVSVELAQFDDSIQPTGNTTYDPWPHAEMKKLHHTLVLTVSGPDEAKIRACITEAAGAGLIAAIIVAYATRGAALLAVVSAFLSTLTACLGAGFDARVDHRSNWAYWWT